MTAGGAGPTSDASGGGSGGRASVGGTGGDDGAGGEAGEGACSASPDGCVECTGNSQCDDSNECTDDSCVNNSCVYANHTGSCEDDIACTNGVCGGGSCNSTPNCTGGLVCNMGSGFCETNICSASQVLFEGGCYEYLATSQTRAAAQAACQALGQTGEWDLVGIEGPAENDFVGALVSEPTWLGGNDIAADGTWSWPDGTLLTNSRCAEGQTEVGGSCFARTAAEENSWTDARIACQALGVNWDFAVIEDASQNALVQGYAVGEEVDGIWLGLTDIGGVWQWADGTAISYSNWEAEGVGTDSICGYVVDTGIWADSSDCLNNKYGACEGPVIPGWAPNEPNAGADDCMTMGANGLWFTEACGSSHPAVCEQTLVCGAMESEHLNKCYFVTVSADYLTARAECVARGQGWDTIRIDDSAENAFADDLIAETSWIGATDAGTNRWEWSDGSWFWSGTSSGSLVAPFTFQSWDDTMLDSEPDSTWDCAQMNINGDWADANCTVSIPAICEGPRGSP